MSFNITRLGHMPQRLLVYLLRPEIVLLCQRSEHLLCTMGCMYRPKQQHPLSLLTFGKSSSAIRIKWSGSSRYYSTVAASSVFTSRSQSDASYQSPVQIDLNLDTRLSPENVDKLRQNLSTRGLQFDFDQLLEDYKEWRKVDQQKINLETERTRIAKAMAVLVKDQVNDDKIAEKAKLTQMGKVVREELRDIMSLWWAQEEKVRLQALQLPTDLHHSVHAQDKHIDLFDGTLKQEGDVPSHIQIGEQLGLLKFSNVGPKAVYLLGDLAEAELTLMHDAMTKILSRGYTPIAGSEIFRTVVVDGCGLDHLSGNQILTLHQKEADKHDLNMYHLKGNSLLSYAAFFTKMQLTKKKLPVEMCSVGRHYNPISDESLPGLYGALQSNRVTMFAACASGDETLALHDRMVSAAWDTVTSLGLPARKTLLGASGLALSESLRTGIAIWAPSLRDYVEVGHVSIHNDYVSQRLMSRSMPEGGLLHMVSGVAVDSAVVLASLLEHQFSKGEVTPFKITRLNS